MRQQDGYYLIYTFGAAHLERHAPLDPHRPDWSPRGDSLAAVESAEYLKEVLPESVHRLPLRHDLFDLFGQPF